MKPYLVYFGTGARDDQAGIYAARFDPATGELDSLGQIEPGGAPGFLEIHPSGDLLFATVRMRPEGDEEPFQGAAAYTIDRATGKLTFINQVSGQGSGPAHITVDHGGKTVSVANYGSGSTTTMPVRADGSLGEAASFIQHEGSSINPERQAGPHAHSVNFSPDDRFLIAADLGLDQVIIYSHDPATSKIEPHGSAATVPGGGPRHFTFHPNGKSAYVINEMANSVTAFSWDAEAGTLEELQTINTLPEGFDGESHTAEVLVHPSGKFLYGSNRGHDSIAVFAVNEADGTLTFVETVGEGITVPRNFRIGPTGQYLFVANQRGDSVKLFSIDQETGRLTSTGVEIEAPVPQCVRFVAVK